MRLLCSILLALFLFSCAEIPAHTHRVPSRDLVKVWIEQGYPRGSCSERAPKVRAVLVKETETLCGRPGVAACYLGPECGGLFALGGCYDIVVIKADGPLPALLRHELTHWLLDCSGLVPGGDYYHMHELWKMDGFGPLYDVDWVK